MSEYKMTDENMGTVDVKELGLLDKETNYIMKSEFRTGLVLSILYLAFVFFIPIINWHFPEIAFYLLFGGMSLSWFLTSLVAMAMAFFIAYIHTKLYERRLKTYHTFSTQDNQSNKRGGNIA